MSTRPWAGPGTRFALETVAGHRSGRRGRRLRRYLVAVHGPLKSACVIENEATFSDGRPGARLRAVLDPRRTKGGRWCRGRFRGTVRYQDGLCCRDGAYFRLRTRIAGRFAFTVR